MISPLSSFTRGRHALLISVPSLTAAPWQRRRNVIRSSSVITNNVTGNKHYSRSCSRKKIRTVNGTSSNLGAEIISTATRERFFTGSGGSSSSSSETIGSSGGLFTIAELKQPSDFTKLAIDAIRKCDDIRNDLRKFSDSSSSDESTDDKYILYQLDSISRIVCNVIDAAELCRSVHRQKEWRDQANHAFGYLSDYISQLNADTSLYYALRKVSNNKNTNYSQEDTRFIQLLQNEFERNGIHLPDKQRERVCELHSHITTLETMFTQNIIHDHRTFRVPMEDVEQVIPRHILDTYNAQNDSNLCDLNTSQSDIINTLLKYSSNRTLRKEVFMEYNTACKENLRVLDGLIETRSELAALLQYPSYSHYFLHANNSIIPTPEKVRAFLQQLQEQNTAAYRKEMNTLHQIHQQIGEDSSSTNSIEPWDVPYYVSIAKASIHERQKQQNDGQQRYASPTDMISKHLTIDSCLDAIQVLVDRLFNIRMEEGSIAHAEEKWDVVDHHDANNNKNRSKIRRMEFYDKNDNDNLLGIMYLDLYKRPDKYNHSAHFTVRCGCRADYFDIDAPYQLPVVALVCNFNDNYNISHGEVETLFHELGHALHSLLSKTTFQHLAGTRTAMDFVEIPSHLFEYFVYDAAFLPILMDQKDDDDDGVFHSRLIHQLNQSKQLFRGIENQNQILFAMLDQELFGNNATTTTTQTLERLHQSLHIPYANGTHWHSRFGHLVTYGAGYYSYLFAKKHADDIWTQLFSSRGGSSGTTTDNNSSSSSLDYRRAGERLWKELLMHGGSRDPSILLQNIGSSESNKKQ